MNAILAVAGLAFRESARNRVLHALVAATLVAAATSHVFAYVSGDEIVRQHKVIADMSLSAIALLGTLAAIFLGTDLVAREVQRRTIYAVLARPIDRTSFIIGKYLGLTAVLAIAVAAMGAGFLLIFAAGGGQPTVPILLALVFTFLELSLVVAIAILFSVIAHPIEGAVFAFVVTLAGHVTSSLNDLGLELVKRVDGTPPEAYEVALQKVLYVAYVLLPNLENFNLRAAAAHDLPLEPGPLLGAAAYCAVYAAIVLAAASLGFRRKIL